MDIRKAAAAMGRAGRGEAKRRGDSDHYRALRARRPKPQVYESRGEWGGYTVREGLRGWIVDVWSAHSGATTGARYRVGYDLVPKLRLDQPINDLGTLGADLVIEMRNAPGVRVLRRGHVVR